MEFFKVILRRVSTQVRQAKPVNNIAQKLPNIETKPYHEKQLHSSKFKFISNQKFPNYEFARKTFNDFNKNYKDFHSSKLKFNNKNTLTKLFIGCTLVGSATYLLKNRTVKQVVGEYNSDLPDFTMEEVEKHKTRTTGVWITFNRGVYDITDYLDKNPEGTENLQICAGGPLYSFSSPNGQIQDDISDILERYRIDTKVTVGEYKKGLPNYTMDQVAQHKTRETRVWLTYKQGVYDITDYLRLHPAGSDNILMAAGSSLDPYWAVYTNHLKDSVYVVLEKYRIGNLKASTDGPKPVCYVPGNISGFENEPERDPRLIPVTEKPFNGGCKAALLTNDFFTPNEIFYIRNHLPVPIIKTEEEYRLTIEIEGGASKVFTMQDLKKFPEKTAIITAQCGGLRRQEMTDKLQKDTQGVKWEINGVSNAEWKGVLLIDVLKAAGYDENSMPDLQHLQFTSAQSAGGPYVTGIPIQRVQNPKNNVMLAYEMNGKQLHPDHGFPLRVIVPGCIGARWVKQIEKIELKKQECDAFWHQQLYKYFGPYVTNETADYASLSPVQELPVISAILSPADNETVGGFGGSLTVKGFAYSGGGNRITRVEVSNNRGKSWMPARLVHIGSDPVPYHFTWTLWECDVPTGGKKCVDLWVKATDSACNTQPEAWEHIYNIRGVACTAFHKIRVNVK